MKNIPVIGRATTPKIPCRVKEVVLKDYDQVNVYIKQHGKQLIIKTKEDLEFDDDDKEVFYITLTQEETLALSSGISYFQVHAKNGEGAVETFIKRIQVYENLRGEVI